MKTKIYRKWRAAAALLVLFLGAYAFLIRPWMLDWGAPPTVQQLQLAGDGYSDGLCHTRAVLVRAQPNEIWPWIAQLGQERGGFYSYTWLENLFAADMHNVYELRPELQRCRWIGDTIWLATPRHYDRQGYQIVAKWIPWASLVMVGGADYQRIQAGEPISGSWSIYLHPADDASTWLIARSCNANDLPFGEDIFRFVVFEPAHFIMEQKMLRTIRDLAEAGGNP